MNDTKSVIELLLSGMATLQKEQAARSEDPALHAGVDRWFAAHWPQRKIIGSSNYTVPQGGASNEMLQFDVTWSEDDEPCTERFVLRFEGDDEPIAPPASDPVPLSIEVEHKVQEALSSSGTCPTAPLVGMETDTSFLGRPFYVMHHVAGRVPPTAGQNVGSFFAEDLSPDERGALIRNGLAAVAAFHRMDWEAAGLSWMHKDPETAVSRQLQLYRDMSERYLRGAEHTTLAAAFEWLEDNAPAPGELSLTWGDSRPGNVMFDDACDVAAVLDWELAALLPPGVDLGHWMLSDYMVHEIEGTERLPGVPTREEQLAIYEDHFGAPVTDLGYWEVFAAMKSAYVFIRVVRRMQDQGVLPASGDALFYENFAVQYLEERIIHNAPELLAR
jgi:aminoglycoside phosphotransferase (APT) family kinase protein